MLLIGLPKENFKYSLELQLVSKTIINKETEKSNLHNLISDRYIAFKST